MIPSSEKKFLYFLKDPFRGDHSSSPGYSVIKLNLMPVFDYCLFSL
ncbi:hypothetical protein VULLAG_LOCUS9131 [Vulpes lagopus]